MTKTTVGTIKQAVEQVAESFRQTIIDYRTAYYQHVVDTYRKDCEAFYTKNPTAKRTNCVYAIYNQYDRGTSYKRSVVTPFLTSTEARNIPGLIPSNTSFGPNGIATWDHVYSVAENVNARIAKAAKQDADQAVASFIAKMTKKLEGIAGQEASVEFGGSLDRNSFHITTANKASFTVRNEIVMSTSCLGKLFNRYPTTFHNVKLADGTSVNAPSEAKVKAALGK